MKILIIEDEPKLAAFLQQGLEENDFDTEVVYDGLMGQRMVLQHTFDMVILDVIIPHLNGLELCAIIKKEKPHLPVLMLTALGTTDDKITGLDAGADGRAARTRGPGTRKGLKAHIEPHAQPLWTRLRLHGEGHGFGPDGPYRAAICQPR